METHGTMTKEMARANGLKHYSSGPMCKRGHEPIRYVSDGACVACKNQPKPKTVRPPKPPPMTGAEYAKRWRERHPEAVKAQKVAAVATGKSREYSRRYYAKKPEMAGKWAKDNPALACARTMRYNAKRRTASVPWANQEMIDAFYVEARRLTEETGIPHEVDHIYPIQGKTVTGLHHELNLRVVTRFENRSKGNRIIGEAA